MKRKYKVVIAYDGTAYSGWQYQENALGIQQVVEEAVAFLERSPVRVFGSSRTDAGVHAKGFVAHFDLTKSITVNLRSSTGGNGVFMENGLWYNKAQFNFRGHVCLVYT